MVVVVILSRPGHRFMQPELAYHPTKRVIVHLSTPVCFFHHRKPVSPMIRFRMFIRIKHAGTLRACPAAVLPLSHTLPLAASSGWLVTLLAFVVSLRRHYLVQHSTFHHCLVVSRFTHTGCSIEYDDSHITDADESSFQAPWPFTCYARLSGF